MVSSNFQTSHPLWLKSERDKIDFPILPYRSLVVYRSLTSRQIYLQGMLLRIVYSRANPRPFPSSHIALKKRGGIGGGSRLYCLVDTRAFDIFKHSTWLLGKPIRSDMRTTGRIWVSQRNIPCKYICLDRGLVTRPSQDRHKTCRRLHKNRKHRQYRH